MRDSLKMTNKSIVIIYFDTSHLHYSAIILTEYVSVIILKL